MENPIRYAKDLKTGDRFTYHGVQFTAEGIVKTDGECPLCHGGVSGKVMVGVDGGVLNLFPREPVEMQHLATDDGEAPPNYPEDAMPLG